MALQQWQALEARILAYNPGADRQILQHLKALALEKKTQSPPVGSVEIPFYPLSVADILISLRLDLASIAAGMLVQRVSVRELSIEEIENDYGRDVAFLVKGVAKISLISPGANVDVQENEFRKMILAMAKDIRVILVRLALCLQQVRAAVKGPPRRIPLNMAQEIQRVYAPIAHRLGIHWIKNELEDCSFRLGRPEIYKDLKIKVDENRKGGGDVVKQVVRILGEKLQHYGIEGEISGREKNLYSIWRKLVRKSITLEELYDLIAYRIIVKDTSSCYRALGMVHGEFKPIPGRFKDYIAL
ncbi:HD domain-containing protein, partial [Magnetococcales bacterium HHB-1]